MLMSNYFPKMMIKASKFLGKEPEQLQSINLMD